GGQPLSQLLWFHHRLPKQGFGLGAERFGRLEAGRHLLLDLVARRVTAGENLVAEAPEFSPQPALHARLGAARRLPLGLQGLGLLSRRPRILELQQLACPLDDGLLALPTL